MERRRTILNETHRLMLVFTEILGEDYWLRPAEAVDIVAEVESLNEDFDIVDNERGVTVWPSDSMG
jgi:hypothetical protein